MTNTPRMSWPLVDENVDPWIDQINALFLAQDASVYCEREDSNLIVSGGGSFSFVGSSNTLSWTGTIQMTAAVTGFLWQILPGSIVITPGSYGYVSLVRAPQSNITLTLTTGQQIPTGNNGLALCVNIGGTIYFRNGFVLSSGQSGPIFSPPNQTFLSTNSSAQTFPNNVDFVYPGTVVKWDTVGLVNQSNGTWTLQNAGNFSYTLTTTLQGMNPGDTAQTVLQRYNGTSFVDFDLSAPQGVVTVNSSTTNQIAVQYTGGTADVSGAQYRLVIRPNALGSLATWTAMPYASTFGGTSVLWRQEA